MSIWSLKKPKEREILELLTGGENKLNILDADAGSLSMEIDGQRIDITFEDGYGLTDAQAQTLTGDEAALQAQLLVTLFG